jgi:flagellar hook protein FlgE
MGSFSTSLSGVEASSQDLAVIANNLANLDTTAYKDQEANFGDFFYQMLGTNGAGDPVQIGAGTIIGSVISAYTQGNVNSTGVPTDMAIQGGGFFIEQNGSETLYTRAGDFSLNANGYLTTSDGGYVLGYPAVNGVISPTQTLSPLQLSSGQTSPPNATTDVELTMNLDAADQAASSGTAATGTLTVSANAAANDTVTVGSTTYTFVASLTGVTAADEVLIDPSTAANTLANLAAAINGGTGSGTTYSTGTTANTSVTATAGTTTLDLTATQAGTADDSIATTATWGTFGAATLAGGASSGAATAATGTLTETATNAAANDTVTIGSTTYTFVASLTGVTTADQVLIDPSTAANTLANLAAAINGGTGAGTTYSTGTTANTSVTATAGSTTLTLTSTQAGTAGNSIATSATWGTFGAATLANGADASSTATSGNTFSEPVVVYDSLGMSHTLTFDFTKTAANTWSYQITIPAADVGATGSPTVLNSGTLQFDGNGNLISPTTNVTGVTISNLADGATKMNFSWQLLDPTTNLPVVTQTTGASNVSNVQQNGNSSGSLQSFTINSDGTIEGVFSNGLTLNLGQVALATFQNTQGLQLNGNNTYLALPTAGVPSIGRPGSGGRGTIVGQSLESSNVDMTTELSNLIVAERNYQSNARAISTADQMINYVLTMQP